MAISAVGSNPTAPVPSAVNTASSNTAPSAANANNAAKTATDNGATNNTGSGDQVTLSPEAQQAQAQDQAADPAQQPPAGRGDLVFDAMGATVGGKRVALMDIIDNTDGTYTDTERQAAVRQINQRETAGFRWAEPASDSQDPVALKQYYATYLNYLNKLPPEEQNSSRYKGQVEVAHQLMNDADRQIVMSSIQQISLANYSDSSGMGLFAPMMTSISSQISQQLAGLPNTNLNTTARFYQLTVNQPRTADQVLASPDPTADNENASTGGTSVGTPSGVSGTNLNIQA
jgi:hypothetical protein